jgi:O-antigen ligase
MTQYTLERSWENSLVGRVLTYLLFLWEGSLLCRGLSAIAGYIARISPHSWVGRVWYSDWPLADHFRDSVTGRLLAGLSDWFRRMGMRVGPFLGRTWESSWFVRTGKAVIVWAAPVLETSLLFQTFCGYSADTVLPPAETGKELASPLLYLLGAVLGFAALIPSPDPTAGGGGLLNPTRLMLLGVWGLALLWVLQKPVKGDFRWRAPAALLPLAAFMVVAFVSTLGSPAKGSSLLTYVIWLTAVLVFFMLANLVRNTRDAAAFLGPVIAAGALMGVWALYQWKFPPVIEEAWVDPAQGTLTRVFAGMNNPNYLAEYMVLYIPLAIALLARQPKRRLEMAGLTALMCLAILLTGSRGGWGSLLLAIGIYVLLRAGRWTFVVLLGGLLLPFVIPQSIITRFQTAFVGDTSALYRVNVWKGVLAMLKAVWPLGSGPGGVAFADVYQAFMLSGARAGHAHNTYLEIFAETGILGIATILWALLVTLRRLISVGYNKLRSPLIAAAGAAIVGLLLQGMVEYIWYNPKLLFAFWAVAGLGLGLVLGDKEDAPHEQQTEDPAHL